MAPRSEHSISPKNISREYALVCNGRFVSTARGEQAYFDADNLATASEGCKSNALMRCCKDLGIASELWYVIVIPLVCRFNLMVVFDPLHVISLIYLKVCRELTTFTWRNNRDPTFIRKFKKQYCEEVFVEHAVTKKKKKLWKRKDQGDFGE